MFLKCTETVASIYSVTVYITKAIRLADRHPLTFYFTKTHGHLLNITPCIIIFFIHFSSAVTEYHRLIYKEKKLTCS